MKIYIDSEYKCHTTPADGRREIETDAFDGKCRQYIEGCLFVPEGERLILDDGTFFSGEMVAPWMDYSVIAEYQAIYEEQQKTINEYEAALSEIETALGV